MDGSTTKLRMTNREALAHRVVPPDATESAEMTELLHHLVTEVARVHRGESDGAPWSQPYSPKEFRSRPADMETPARPFHRRAAVPVLAADHDFDRALGRRHFARACFLPATAHRIQGPAVSCS